MNAQSYHTVRIGLLHVCILSLLAAVPAFSRPRLHCAEPKYDFGTLISSGPITNDFVLTNRGDEPVVISKVKDCCGVKSTISPMVIPPGSNAVCKSIFTTKNRYGSQDKQILIASNDRKKPYYEVKMVGTLLRPVEFKPRYIKLNNLLPDAEIDYTITATNILEKAVTLDSVASTVPGIRAEVIDRGNPRNWTVLLSSSGPLPVGKINGKVLLNFSSGTIAVPVIGTIKPIIQVVPARIQFSGRSTNAVERLIMLRSDKEHPFNIESAILESAQGAVDVKPMSASAQQLKLKIILSSITTNSVLLVKTTCTSQPSITIPLTTR